jgi:hypothetical protein
MLMYKLSFYVPASHLEPIKKALFSVGAGRYNAYDQCCWQVAGEGQFRPLGSSTPFLGMTNQLQKVVEYKVEMVCHDEIVKEAIQILLLTHPYEQPAYSVYQILTLENL